MAGELDVRVLLKANASEFRKGMRRATEGADGFDQRIGRIARGPLADFTSRMGRGVRAIGRFATSIPGLAGAGGLGLLVKRSIETGDEIAKLADRIGVSTGFLQEMRRAADLSGVAQGDFDNALSRLNRRLGLFATDGTGPATKAFEELGLAADIESGKLAGAEEVFNAAVARLEGVEDASKRAAIASQLFGEDAGPRLVNLINQGAGGIEEMRQQARDLGQVIDEDLLRGAEGAQDALSTLGKVIDVNLTAAILAAAPEIQKITESIVKALPQIIEGIGGVVDFLSTVEAEWVAWGAAIAGIFATAGPILLGISAFVKAITAILTFPVGTIAVLLAGAVTAWFTWKDEIKAAVGAVIGGLWSMLVYGVRRRLGPRCLEPPRHHGT